MWLILIWNVILFDFNRFSMIQNKVKKTQWLHFKRDKKQLNPINLPENIILATAI